MPADDGRRHIRLMMALLGVAATGAILCGVAYWNVGRLDEAGERETHASHLIGRIDVAILNLTQAEAAARGFIASGDETFLATFEGNLTRAVGEVAAARASENDPQALAAFDALEQALTAKITSLREALRRAAVEGLGSAQEYVGGSEARARMQDVLAAAEELRLRQLALLDSADAESKEANAAVSFTVAGSFTLLVVLMAGLGARAWLERRRTPQSNASDDRARRIVDASGDAWIGLDADCRFTEWNAAAESLFGYTPADQLGRPLTSMFPASAHDHLVASLARTRDGRVVTDATGVARDGRHIPVRLWLFRLDDADAGTVYGAFVRDRRRAVQVTTALEASQQELQKDRELLQAIVDNSQSAIFVKDVDGRFQLVNRRWERIMHQDRDSVIGSLDRDVLPAEMWERFRPHDEHVIRTRVAEEFEELGRGADGDERVYLSLRVPMLDENGEVERICGFATDITDQKRTMDAAAIARQVAESASRAKTDFLSRMSHELRTPLNVILGFGQLLEMDARNPNDREAVDHILKAGRHLLDLINEVLDLTRVEENHLALSIEPIALNEVVAEVMGLVRPLAEERHLALTNDVASADVTIMADRQRIKQVLLNLLSNAIKYNKEHGSVTVSCMSGDTGTVRLQVTDSGLGIRKERMVDLFQPFERLGAEATTIEGTGLGLALSRRLVEAMGGDLGVASELGIGSTFWVDLPVGAPPGALAMTDDAPALEPAQATSGGTILYVEDNLANVALVERILERRPALHLIPAMQGRIAISLAREHQPRMVILDLHLPDMAGEAVLHELQADPATREIPVLVASADATPGTIARLEASGARGFLPKPFAVARFLEMVDAILEGDESP